MSKIIYSGIYGNKLTVDTDALGFISFIIGEETGKIERFVTLKAGDVYTLIQQLREMLNLLAQSNIAREQDKLC